MTPLALPWHKFRCSSWVTAIVVAVTSGHFRRRNESIEELRGRESQAGHGDGPFSTRVERRARLRPFHSPETDTPGRGWLRPPAASWAPAAPHL